MTTTRAARKAHMSGVILALSLASIAVADNIPREVARGTKVVPGMTVAYETHTSPMNKIATDITKTFSDLLLAAQDAGLHPAGPPTAMANFNGAADGNVQWEAWIPIADEPRKEDLAPEAVVKVKKVPETRVAFTYHLGDFAMLENTFTSLVAWAQAQALELTGSARTVVYFVPPVGEKAGSFAIECQLELPPQGAQ